MGRPGRWKNFPISEDFHPGASFEIRWIPNGIGGAGQQCTYDTNRRLITHGLAAGTPDTRSPSGNLFSNVFNVLWHTNSDVLPFGAYGYSGEACSAYLDEFPPNNGNSCPNNTITLVPSQFGESMTCSEIISSNLECGAPVNDYLFSGSFTNPDANLLWDMDLDFTNCQEEITGDMVIVANDQSRIQRRRVSGTWSEGLVNLSASEPYNSNDQHGNNPCINMSMALINDTLTLSGTWSGTNCPQGGEISLTAEDSRIAIPEISSLSVSKVNNEVEILFIEPLQRRTTDP